jgi:hypothetical protein
MCVCGWKAAGFPVKDVMILNTSGFAAAALKD